MEEKDGIRHMSEWGYMLCKEVGCYWDGEEGGGKRKKISKETIRAIKLISQQRGKKDVYLCKRGWDGGGDELGHGRHKRLPPSMHGKEERDTQSCLAVLNCSNRLQVFR